METMLEAGPDLVLEAVTGIIKKRTNPSLPRSAAVGTAAATFLEWAREDRAKLEVFAHSLVKLFVPCFQCKTKRVGKAWREKLWRKFHSLRVSTALESLWNALPSEVNSKDPMLCQMVLTDVMEGLIKVYRPLEVAAEATVEEPALTEQEKKALRYVAGYIPVSLRRKLERSSHPHKEEFILCLWEMSEDDTPCDDFLSYTKSWIDRVNRGGLFVVHDMAYLFFEQLELELRRHYNSTQVKTSQLIPSRPEIARLMMEADDVQFHWCLLSAELDEQEGQELLHMIVNLCITIRGFSFAKSLLEQYKQAHSLNTSKAKALRKGLKRPLPDVDDDDC